MNSDTHAPPPPHINVRISGSRRISCAVDMGSKKYPRFGYYVPDDLGPKVMKPTEEIILKRARVCLQQHDGHRRALMLATQASSLAKLTCDTMPETHPSMKDPWLAEQGRQPQSASSRLPNKQAQITQRVKKLAYLAGLARMKHEYRGRLIDTAFEMMNHMEDAASKGLRGQQLRDYSNHVRSLSLTPPTVPTASHHQRKLRHVREADMP